MTPRALCTFQLESARFGIPTGDVREILGSAQIQPVPLAPPFVYGVISYRGEILPVIGLRTLLNMKNASRQETVLVLSGDGHELFGIAVDGVEGIANVEPETCQENPGNLDPFAMRLFQCSYRDAHGLIVQLSASELSPERLIQTALGSNPAANAQEKECSL